MKFTYEQIINLTLLTIIIILLVNMSNKKFFKKLYNLLVNFYEGFCNNFIDINFSKKWLNYDKISNSKYIMSESNQSISEINSHIFNELNNTLNNAEKLNHKKEIKKNKDDLIDEHSDTRASTSFYYSENLEDESANKIYEYLQSIIEPNTINISNYKILNKHKADQQQVSETIEFIQNKINSNKILELSKNEFTLEFSDFELKNNIVFFETNKLFEFQPIVFNANYLLKDNHNNNSYKGIIRLQLESYFQFDDPNTIFISQTKFKNKFGTFKISRITITGFNSNSINKLNRFESKDRYDIFAKQKNLNNHNIIENVEKHMDEIESNKKFVYNLTDSNDEIEQPSDKYKENRNSQYEPLTKSIQEMKKNIVQVDRYSETINSIIPDKIEITPEGSISPQTYN